jgi:hypothetical protein
MDTKLRLLKGFYGGLPKDRAKVETNCHGFPFLEALLSDGAVLEYGEMHRSGQLHKYKLSHIPGHRMDELLQSHVGKTSNVCLYFDDVANSLFCLNLDNNHKTGNTVLIPEMKLAMSLLRERLTALGCEPLVVASGRGYHLWCRLASAVENKRLHDFMLRLVAMALAGLHGKGLDYNNIKANFYPDPRIRNTVSLRLFGSDHARNKVFSRVLAQDVLLDEAASWDAFEHHLRHKTIAAGQFDAACKEVMAAF